MELRGVGQVYTTDSGAQVEALTSTDLTIEPGEFVCLVGPSGCGKSTLLNMIAGFLPPTSGDILLDGAEVEGPGPDRGVVFQKANLYPWLTVQENVELAGKYKKVPKAQRAEHAAKYLEMVGLAQFAQSKPYELSGGMQQRAQIARVLAAEPDILLMDEPFGALDALTRERIQLELLNIWRSGTRTVIFITHSVDEAVFLSTRTLVMSARPGRIIEDVAVNIPLPDDVDPGQKRSHPEFQRLRDHIAQAIYAAQGASTSKASTD